MVVKGKSCNSIFQVKIKQQQHQQHQQRQHSDSHSSGSSRLSVKRKEAINHFVN